MKIISQNFPAQYWHLLETKRMQCDLCPHACVLQDGQCGRCGVRCNRQQQMVTLYGKVSGFAVDPVEKKPFYHFLPGSQVLSFGTIGCNLSCKFCQNWQISTAEDSAALSELNSATIIAMAQREHCASVAFTYNEPTIFIEYAMDVAKECRKSGIHTIAVTNGYICAKPREEFYRYIDAANVDLKAFTDSFYQKITGAHLAPVLDTLSYLKHQTQVWLEITYLLIPGENDSDREIDSATKWIATSLGKDVPVHFSAFYPTWKMPDKPATLPATLLRARAIAQNNGLCYVYTGNIYDPEGSHTYCHNCGKCVIERSGYMLGAYNLTATGHCKFCHAKCTGVFANQRES